jgi:thiamine monophosphate synthase
MMAKQIYVVEESDDFSDDALAAKMNELYDRGYDIIQVIEKDSDSGNGYTVLAKSANRMVIE